MLSSPTFVRVRNSGFDVFEKEVVAIVRLKAPPFSQLNNKSVWGSIYFKRTLTACSSPAFLKSELLMSLLHKLNLLYSLSWRRWIEEDLSLLLEEGKLSSGPVSIPSSSLQSVGVLPSPGQPILSPKRIAGPIVGPRPASEGINRAVEF